MGASKEETDRRDCESSEKLNKHMNNRIKMEEIVIQSLISLLSFEGSFDKKVDKVLQYLGEFSETDRSYIFLFSSDGYSMSNTHEWTADSISPEKENLQNLPCKTFTWWTEKIKRKEIINIPVVDELGEFAVFEKEFLQAQGIQSVVVVPLMINEKSIGFLGFDAVKHLKEWENEDVALLQTLGNIIVSARERYQRENKILKSELNYRILFENANDGIFLLDLEGKHLKVNKMAAKMLGYTQEEIQGLSYKDMMPLEEIGISEQMLSQLIDGECPPPYEKTLMTKKGKRLPVEINLTLIKDKKGQPSMIHSVVRDLSTRKTTQKEIKRLTFFKNSVFEILNKTLTHNMGTSLLRALLELNMKVIDNCDHGWVFELYENQLIPILEMGNLKKELPLNVIKRMSQRLRTIDDLVVLNANELLSNTRPDFIKEDIHFLIIPIKDNDQNTIVFVLKQAEVNSTFMNTDLETGYFLKRNFETMLQRTNMKSR